MIRASLLHREFPQRKPRLTERQKAEGRRWAIANGGIIDWAIPHALDVTVEFLQGLRARFALGEEVFRGCPETERFFRLSKDEIDSFLADLPERAMEEVL